jgi:Ca-activated chloride channel family protein
MKQAILVLLFISLYGFTASAQDDAALARGNDFYRRQLFERAEDQYREAVNADPSNTIAQYNLGNALYQQKKFDEAVKWYSSAAAGEKDIVQKSSAHYNAGVSHVRQNDLESAIESFKSALRLTPYDKQARENLQKAMLELKKKQDQQKQAQKEREKNPSKMNQDQANKELERLQEKEKKLQNRIQKQNKEQGGGGAKDW